MPRTKKAYESKAVTTSISCTSRKSIKIGDNFFTVEYSEERAVPADANMEEERRLLWECVDDECYDQIQEILDEYKNRKKR